MVLLIVLNRRMRLTQYSPGCAPRERWDARLA